VRLNCFPLNVTEIIIEDLSRRGVAK